MLEVIRTIEDAKEWGKQYHDMCNGDISMMANPERAVIIMYKHILEQEQVIVKQLAEIVKLKNKKAKTKA